jgi:molybdenum cofactor cytidylyltransferase
MCLELTGLWLSAFYLIQYKTKTDEDLLMILSIIILAGGRSKRMGTMKQLLPWGKKTILQHVVDTAAGVEPAEIIVVLGHNADEISRVLSGKPVKIVVNTEFSKGMSSSLQTALRHISPESDTYIFMLGDQPLVTVETLKLLLLSHQTSNLGITVPVYQGVKGRPVVIDSKYREELMTLKGEIGAKQVIDHHPDDVLEAPVDSEEVIIDIDTQEEYRKYSNNV